MQAKVENMIVCEGYIPRVKFLTRTTSLESGFARFASALRRGWLIVREGVIYRVPL